MTVLTTDFPTVTSNSTIVGAGEWPACLAVRDRILVVDPLPLPRQLLIKKLSENYDCDEASSANEANALLRKNCYSAVITETMLPGLSGIELLRLIVRDYPDTSVIVVSSIDRPQRALDAVRLGAFDYIIKPCDPTVIQLTLERAIERRNLLTRSRQYKRDLEQRNRELEEGKRELQRLQAQIVHNEKMASLGKLTAGIAHELNNPVGFVYGNLDLIRERLAGLFRLLFYYDYTPISAGAAVEVDAIKREIDYANAKNEFEEIIGDCLEGAERIREIVQNLRTFSRLDEAKVSFVNVHEGINSSIRMLSRYFSADNISLVREFGDLPKIEANAGQLNQVWMNLLANGAQAVGEVGGEVKIKTELASDRIVVQISDTGIGIPKEDLGRIFDPFFTSKPVGEGSGLGLSISFGIVERHGGNISVVSQPGKGSTFTVSLPLDNSRPLGRTP